MTVHNCIVSLLGAAVVLTACAGGDGGGPSPAPEEVTRQVDVGGYGLWIHCEGSGSPSVVLEAGLGAAGTSAWFDFARFVGEFTRVCDYDRAGVGTSDPRPKGIGPVTGGLMADELHALLATAGVEPPYVLVGHSYGGIVVRLFAERYPDEVAGMVLEDASNEWEIPVWPRIDPSPWVDGRVTIDIEATADELREGGDLSDVPLAVVTAGDYSEFPAWVRPRWRTFQARLAGLSTDGVQVVARGIGHFIHSDRPALMVEAVRTVVEAVRNGTPLPPCEEAFRDVGGACPGA